MKQEINDYSLGLDIGVASTGWAVLDGLYTLAKTGNKHLWGSNIFPEGSTAKDRRIHRSTRRLYSRKKQRIKLLQDLTSEMIYPVDPLFFKRMQYSYTVKEDRPDFYTDNSLLFIDDKVFEEYKKYKTIYHLRYELMKSDEKKDPRLIYLALHHIVKYRGNFLYEGQTLNVKDDTALEENLSATLSYLFSDENIDSKEVIDKVILNDKDYKYKKDKVKCLKSYVLDKELQKVMEAVGNAIIGYKFNVSVLFGIDFDKKSISFKDSDIEESKSELQNTLSEDEYVCFENLEKCYEYLVLKQILNHSKSGEMTISASMIGIYEEHNADIKLLKTILKDLPEEKKKIFGKGGAYDLYIHSPGKNDFDSLYSAIKKSIETIDSSYADFVREKMTEYSFLIRQNSTDNNAIPYQLHLNELKMIINNQKKYYPCLEKNMDKIISLVEFRIPYYIGPLDENAKNAWIIKKENIKEPIRPWNWKELVDIDSTAKKFIDRMRNHCTYILDENTLPSNSILLCRFNLLNELNKIRFSDDKKYVASSIDVKKKIIHDLFLKKNEVKESDLKNWIINNQLRENDDFELIGFQNDKRFASSLKSEIKFRQIYGLYFEEKIDEIEEIIEYLTVYNDSKIIERKLRNEFVLTDDQINKIKTIRYNGYGRFSRKLINGILSSNSSNNIGTIYEIMEKSNDNFMQVLNNEKYDFISIINEHNGENKNKSISYSDVDELPISPALKRGVWQSIRVFLDVEKYMGKLPKNLYLEFAREEGEKERTNSRYLALKKILEDTDTYKEIKRELEQNKDNLSDDRIYLYFTQLGKCMYSGKPLHIDELSNYQIDHIIPRSYTTDNSIENRILVIADENQRKKDSLLLSETVVNKMKNYWDKLYELKLIGDKKITNLTRTRISDKEKERFIARQLVETRQICVHVKNLIQKYYPEVRVVVVHAPLSSEFRKKFNLYKVREINDFHHAQDAYLAAMIGQYMGKKYPSIYGEVNTFSFSNIMNDIQERIDCEKKSLGGKEGTIYSFIIQQMGHDIRFDKDGEVYWSGDEEIKYINKLFEMRDYFYNYMTRDYDGELYNATLYKAKDIKAKVPSKANKPVEKYGGYDSLQKAFGLAIEYQKGKKIVRTVVDIPAIYKNSIDLYLRQLNVNKYKVIKKIQKGQLFKMDNCIYSMQSSSEWQTRQPIFFEKNIMKIIFDVTKNNGKNSSSEELYLSLVEITQKMQQYMPLISNQIESLDIENSKEKFMSMNFDNQVKLIRNLLATISKNGSASISLGNQTKSRFGRLSGKTLYLDDAEFIYTSPSGLFKKVIKL